MNGNHNNHNGIIDIDIVDHSSTRTTNDYCKWMKFFFSQILFHSCFIYMHLFDDDDEKFYILKHFNMSNFIHWFKPEKNTGRNHVCVCVCVNYTPKKLPEFKHWRVRATTEKKIQLCVFIIDDDDIYKSHNNPSCLNFHSKMQKKNLAVWL